MQKYARYGVTSSESNVQASVHQLRYIPYEEAHRVQAEELIAVDCRYPRGLALSHVYNQRVPAGLRSNTSTQCVLKWIAQPLALREAPSAHYVTCNHWDIDGFLAVWSLLDPEQALRNLEVLSAASFLGDFREFDPAGIVGLDALKICALLNNEEATHFCLPFGDLDDATMEYQVARRKFEYFLPKFSAWLEDLEAMRKSWEPEYNQVLQDLKAFDSNDASVLEVESHGVSIVTSSRPLHYYAAYSKVRGGGVLTEIRELQYSEFEYRYETRVGRTDKSVISRADLRPLAEEFTKLETNPDVRWTFDNIQEGGPILRPEFRHRPLAREERYQSLGYRLERNLLPCSTIEFETIRTLLLEFLDRTVGSGVLPKVVAGDAL